MQNTGLKDMRGANDGRQRFTKEPTYSQNIRITARERLAFEYLAKLYKLPFNETFRRLLDMGLKELGLDVDNAKFDPPARNPASVMKAK